jgi:hypothetical protein
MGLYETQNCLRQSETLMLFFKFISSKNKIGVSLCPVLSYMFKQYVYELGGWRTLMFKIYFYYNVLLIQNAKKNKNKKKLKKEFLGVKNAIEKIVFGLDFSSIC